MIKNNYKHLSKIIKKKLKIKLWNEKVGKIFF